MIVNCLLYLPVLVGQYYVEPDIHFPYGPITFIPALPGSGIYFVYAATMVMGALVALGIWYRPAMATLFVLTTYVFLLDSMYYQNHEYLIALLSFLMIFLPLDRKWSVRARRHPDHGSDTVPAWVLWLLRFQIGIPYFFGGVAKLNSDWLRGEPLRTWLAARTEIEPINTILSNSGVVWFMAYGALMLDLAIVWLLLYRRTRPVAFVIVTCFHLLNVWLFGLFIFPWLMIAATTLFLEPDWPEHLGRWARARVPRPAPLVTPAVNGAATLGVIPATTSPEGSRRRIPAMLAVGLLVWASIQVALPLRHFAIAGDPSWTEQAHRFAWHMKLRAKQGSVTFYVTSGDRTWQVDHRDLLAPKQAGRLAGNPERIAYFARYLSKQYDGAEVRAETSVSLNGRAPQPIVDPTVDLARVPWFEFGASSWIIDLYQPLPPTQDPLELR